jgi:6-phosphofructokinase 2
MTHFTVRTLTLNPSIDVSSEADKVEPERKIRTCCERIDPGGGGINVARVLQRFGTEVEAIYLAGGATGHAFEQLLSRQKLAGHPVWIEDDTRTSLTIHERSGGREFRFVPEGPTVSGEELISCLKAIRAASCDLFVASGSVPPGIPNDIYATVCSAIRDAGARFILDTSGDELRAALAAGGIFMVKASKEELDRQAAQQIVSTGQAEMVALTLGGEGALLVSREGTWLVPAVQVEPVSTVGAGDSFLAGMVHGLAKRIDLLEAFRMAVAAGTAATLSPGTDLAYPNDLERLLPTVGAPQRLC